MTSLIHEIVLDYLPPKRKQNAKGWIVFNSVCCHHRGHNQDTRGRGNLLITGDGGIIVNCYNCGFKTAYKGGDLGHNFENWLRYLGVPANKIQQAKLEILSKKLSGEIEETNEHIQFHADHFPECQLPEQSQPINFWSQSQNTSTDFQSCLDYLSSRGRAIKDGWTYYWSPIKESNLNKRLIIPFYHNNKVVGYTCRYAGTPPKHIPKYYNSDIPTGYLFNNRVLNLYHRKYVMIVEGPFDAIAIDGISPLGSTLNKQQIQWLNSIDKEKIVIPDRQLKNQDLIDAAIANKWSVSFPEWNEGIKDCADASKQYGRLYTIASVIASRTSSTLEIGVKRQMLRS
jgi:hypothetical protein